MTAVSILSHPHHLRGCVDMRTAGRVVIAVGCVYEIVALATDVVPTITDVVKTVNQHPVGKFAVWAWCGAWAWHFLEPEVTS